MEICPGIDSHLLIARGKPVAGEEEWEEEQEQISEADCPVSIE